MWRIFLCTLKPRQLLLISILSAVIFVITWTFPTFMKCILNTYPPVPFVKSTTPYGSTEPSVTPALHLRPLSVKYNGTPISQLYQPGFDIEPAVCLEDGSGMEVVIIVHSSHANEQQRMAIRQTWGSLALRRDFVVMFLLGQQQNNTISQKVRAEARLYGDIILSRNLDSYNNLTLKTIAMSEWVFRMCPKARFFLKTDDDIFLNVPRFLEFLQKPEVSATNRTVFGSLTRGTHPVRTQDHRHYISVEEYPGETYLDYVQGACYLVIGDLSRDLYHASLKGNFFRFEDIFFTGLMAEMVGARRVGPDNFYVYVENASKNGSSSLDSCTIRNHTVIHFVYFQQMFQMWHTVFDDKLKC